ncbi:MAG TPA: LLM class flavin-dependent oxidoreductase, partial [Devosia sp.]
RRYNPLPKIIGKRSHQMLASSPVSILNHKHPKTGIPCDSKKSRTALAECLAVIRALLAGDTVTHRGRVCVIEARLYSRPQRPVPLYGAAVSAETAGFLGGLADGLLVAAGTPEDTGRVIEAFRANGGEGKPVIVQTALSWAPSDAEALAEARAEWAHAVVGGDARWDVRRPADFDVIAAGATDSAIGRAVHVSASLGAHRDRLAALAALGADEVHLHHVGRNQQAFIEAFGRDVLPALRARAA